MLEVEWKWNGVEQNRIIVIKIKEKCDIIATVNFGVDYQIVGAVQPLTEWLIYAG